MRVMEHKTIIIGGGAGALMLASLLPPGHAVIVEANAKAGEKIRISGGGKCNITNAVMDASCYLGESTFVERILNRFDEKVLLAWLNRKGLQPVLRKAHQYFCPNTSQELLELLLREGRKQRFLFREKVIDVRKRGDMFYVKTNKRTLTASNVVVASGGLSFPKLGASGIGYKIAKVFGHTVRKTAPALVGLTVQKEQFFFKSLAGISTDVEIWVGEHCCHGSLLFAHKGISGPAVLDASLYWEKGKITIDFLPGFSWESLKRSNKNISSLLPMPKRLTKAFLLQFGIEDKAAKHLSKVSIDRLKGLHTYHFAPAGTFGYSKAEVTKGGVATDEIDPATMMSRYVKGLYFVGEVLDVTGQLGGYNFQWAFSSAFVCAKSLGRGKQ